MARTRRQQPALRAPGDVSEVARTSRRRPLYRACGRHHPQPWWFSSRDVTTSPGRFDLRTPDGTSYWALDAATAILEATVDPDQVDPPVLTIAALVNLAVWRSDDVAAARSRLADVTVASVPGLTDELASIVPYDLPWAWADAFRADGRSGILYRARLGMGEALALFGPHGSPPDPPAATSSPALGHLDELPAGFRAGIAGVGTLATLPRAAPPTL